MSNYCVRISLPSDLAHLPEIEKAAAQMFKQVGLAAVARIPPTPLNVFRKSQKLSLLWVVVDEHDHPVGFARAIPLDGVLFLAEMDVLPELSRQGLGTSLLNRVCDDAQARGYRAILLTTYRDVPWNAPFYGRRGFVPLEDDQLTPGLQEVLEREVQAGLMIAPRVAMRLDLN